MTIETAGRLAPCVQRLGVEAFVVIGVRRGVKKRARQIGKLFARRVTTLALKISPWSSR